MLLDTLKQFAFEYMDVEISKDKDTGHIVIENSREEIHNIPDGDTTWIMRIVTKINLCGEIISSKIFKTSKIRIINGGKNSWQIIDKSSQEYYEKLPSLLSETIQKSMEVCSCDIPKLDNDKVIFIDKYGKIITLTKKVKK
jgi:hypothetical protein